MLIQNKGTVMNQAQATALIKSIQGIEESMEQIADLCKVISQIPLVAGLGFAAYLVYRFYLRRKEIQH